MTDESRQLLLDYFMGLAPNESGKNEPYIKEIIEKNVNVEEILKKNVDDFQYFEIVFSVMRGDYLLIFINTSNYEDLVFTWKGSYILVFDKEYNFIKFIDSYNTGAKFFSFGIVADNNQESGNIYLIDTELKNNSEGSNPIRRRLCIINDFTLTDFNVMLLSSFNIPEYEGNQVSINQLVKNKGEGKYFMLYSYFLNDKPYGGALEFINNVGSNNEWNWYPYKGNKTLNWYGFQRGVPNWTSSGLEFNIFCDYKVPPYNNNEIEFIVLKQGEQSCVEVRTLKLPSSVINMGQTIGCEIVSNKIYVNCVSTLSTLKSTNAVIQYNFENEENVILYYKDDYIDKEDKDYIYSSYDDIVLFSIDNMFCFYRNYTETRLNKDTFEIEYVKSNLYLHEYTENKIYEFYIKDLKNITNRNYDLNFFKVYNLYTNNLIFQTFVLSVKQINNSTNYIGLPYKNKNSLIANSSEIYSNDELVFARNLYNKTLNDNTTISTVEIPNTYLNDIDLTSRNLASKTNTNIIEDKNVMRKNVYETVFINFINTVGIGERDINSPGQKYILNKDASILLNNSINNPVDYDQIKFTKARLNYSDGTSKIFNIEIEKQIKDNYLAKISFYVDKQVNNVEWISEDEKNVYYVSDVSSCEIGKIYSLDTLVRKGDDLNGAKFNNL